MVIAALKGNYNLWMKANPRVTELMENKKYPMKMERTNKKYDLKDENKMFEVDLKN
jgi:hypothetical protein